MRVCLYLDPSRIFRWHHWLAEMLAVLPGCEVVTAFAPEARPLPRFCQLLFELERLVYGLKGGGALDPVREQLERLNTVADDRATFDVLIDFAGNGHSLPPCGRLLVPSFNRVPCETGLIAALLQPQPVMVEVFDSAASQCWVARPASEDREVFSRSSDNVLSCTARLIAKAIERPTGSALPLFGRQNRPASGSYPAFLSAVVGLRAAGDFAHKIGRLLGNVAKGGRTWSVGWRFAEQRAFPDSGAASFSIIADDGARYYADPFPFQHNGRNFIFVEEFPYTTGRGCISVFEIDCHGKSVRLGIVLEESHHLSYPFVFELDGEIWMMPESGEARGVYLYRAEKFPFKWKRAACLINSIEAYDATLMRHNNRHWLFLCERAWHSSGWDILSLFHADSLTGEWLPHTENPVLIDAALSRPGGAAFTHNGVTVRPAQDCSSRYGGAISLCRVDALDERTFRQTLIGRIQAGAAGCHTYNRNAAIEVIDVFGRFRGVEKVEACFAPAVASFGSELSTVDAESVLIDDAIRQLRA